ncbi:MAG: sigma-70 family RNA polymerase sigma factor [Armatimonadota bacterium]|nr:sigma-70 family RNA polymerase sigma factor [Armatimonadota bacterium]
MGAVREAYLGSPETRWGYAEHEIAQFEDIVRRYSRHVYNVAYRMAGNDADAKDLTQEAFVRVYRALRKIEPGTPLESWLYRIVTNLFIDMLRKRPRARVESLDMPVTTPRGGEVERTVPDPSGNPEELVVTPMLDGEIQRALESLTEDLRMVVILSDIEGLAYEEIAQAMRVPVGTVKSRLHRARKALRDRLAPVYRRSAARSDAPR